MSRFLPRPFQRLLQTLTAALDFTHGLHERDVRAFDSDDQVTRVHAPSLTTAPVSMPVHSVDGGGQ